jgi:hypothetical protein
VRYKRALDGDIPSVLLSVIGVGLVDWVRLVLADIPEVILRIDPAKV